MANVVAYVITNWQNLPTKSTPIDRTNLLHLEQGVKNVTDFVNTLNSNNGAYLYLCQTPFTSALISFPSLVLYNPRCIRLPENYLVLDLKDSILEFHLCPKNLLWKYNSLLVLYNGFHTVCKDIEVDP